MTTATTLLLWDTVFKRVGIGASGRFLHVLDNFLGGIGTRRSVFEVTIGYWTHLALTQFGSTCQPEA